MTVMKKVFFLIVAVSVALVVSSCKDNDKCWKITGTYNGVLGEWYEDGTRAEVEKECWEHGVENFVLEESNEYSEKTCPETLDLLPELFDD